jgi:signal transduction histidine kinase
VMLTMLLPIIVNIWLPTAPALLMILLAYPIWSWRRLERAHAFLNLELKHLSEDLKQFGGTVAEKKIVRPDLLDDRIAQVKRASQLLRNLQKKRNDTLSFISHDLRTPLATALMLLRGEDAGAQKNKVIDMLASANQLAESFLQLSKAEAILPTQFKTLELNGLLQEVTDNLYEVARAKKIQIHLQVEEAPLWVHGDFALLQRTFENLLQNAIKYSLESGRVAVKLVQKNQTAEIQITDVGIGIAQEKIPHLFQKFSRLEEGTHMAAGSGLGLYFVWLTLEKHGGSVSVESVPNESTTFTVRLPLQS